MKLLRQFLFVFLLINTACLVAIEEDSLDQDAEISVEVEDYNYPEKNMVVVIPSYNNQKWYERNLASVLSQNYTNFRIIYIDDCSSDGTGDLVEQYLVDNDHEQKTYLVHNKVNRGLLYNTYSLVYMCEDDEIVVMLDGDDWFPDNEVLSRLNKVYSSGEIWMTYGQFQYSSSGACGWAMPMSDVIVKNNSFRQFQHIPTHLKTFYAWLFKQIKLEDLLYMGKFFPSAADCATMFPLIEMAGERHRFISDIMYIYNDENAISDHRRSRQLQMHLAQIVQRKKCYKRLARKPTKKDKNNIIKADAIVFAQSPEKLIQLLDSLKTYVSGVDRIFVMYKPASLREINKYNIIRTLYHDVEFDEIDEQGTYFGDILLDIYLEIQKKYILFIKGDTSFEKSVSLNECIKALEETGAYAFYFKLNAQNASQYLPFIECKNTISAWNFAVALDQWSSANSLDFVLHKKGDSLSSTLRNYYGSDVNGIESMWANEGQLDRVGLCFNESHVTSLN